MNFDTYLKSKNLESLQKLKTSALNVMTFTKGREATEATEATTDGDMEIPTQPAVGDPEYWYTCVRFPVPIGTSGDIEACTKEEGIAVCGEWLQ